MKGFKNFITKVADKNIQIRHERVKKPNWSVYYCVYCKEPDYEIVLELARLYNWDKRNASYINVYKIEDLGYHE